ncbi:hypothetical protein ATJ97_0654 [Georgenia soli]|uniref:DUF4190 domain-containing protein n=1 Tax=Georgenia soli TaxID=638953 RepID=A0A2A9EIU2_9MICO|nr:DUF4190 domain-containing protein [Georgenia soli]PFG38182.1 hypothetical protein ATJ97_0654 [Georgenia soli]
MSADDPQPRYGQNLPPHGGHAEQYGQQQYGQHAPAAPQYGQQVPQYGQPPAPQQYGPGYGEQYGYGQNPFASPTTEKNSLGTTALVLGIVGVVGFLVPILSIGLGIAAAVVGTKAKNAVQQGLATNGGAARAGFVLGIVAIVIGVVMWIASAAFMFSDLGAGV